MKTGIKVVEASEVEWLRARYRHESRFQIIHDSLHARPGWTTTYLLQLESQAAGFASTAIAGPWKDRPTIFELYLLPEYRCYAFQLFESFLESSHAKFFEVQSNEPLLAAMLFRYADNIRSEAMVFLDHQRTDRVVPGASVQCQTSLEEIHDAIARQRGGGKWSLTIGGDPVGTGGILFHYNRPYADVFMEIDEGSRRRGYGTYMVQELKRICYEFGGIPCARCNPTNIASQRTLQKAGFVPYAHVLDGELKSSTRPFIPSKDAPADQA